MRCEGAENPPCKRCRHNGLDCLFEKPTREASLTGEAGLEYVHGAYLYHATVDSSIPDEYGVLRPTSRTSGRRRPPFKVLYLKLSHIFGALLNSPNGHPRLTRPLFISRLACTHSRPVYQPPPRVRTLHHSSWSTQLMVADPRLPRLRPQSLLLMDKLAL